MKISKKKPEPKKYYFKKEDIGLLYEHYDRYTRNRTSTNKDILWQFMFNTLNLNDSKNYQLIIENIYAPYVIEIKN